ncbi:hypothetical protein ACJJTC_008461 [Scirpophaga incertulas]
MFGPFVSAVTCSSEHTSDSVRACALSGLGSSQPSSPGSPAAAPPLPRAHFLQLLATLHDLTAHEHALYEAVVLAGTLLLQLGEYQRPDLDREISQDSLYMAAAAKQPPTEMDPNGNPTTPVEPEKTLLTPTKEIEPPAESAWSITLEQFLATMLSQAPVEAFFNEKVSLLPQLEMLRHRDRLQSIS